MSESPKQLMHKEGVGSVPTPYTSRRRRFALPPRSPLGKWWYALLFILPGLLIYSAFVLIPIVNTVRYSFYDWTGFSEPIWRGLGNYQELLNDADFIRAIGNNFFFVIFYTLIPIGLALFLTSLLSRSKVRGLPFFRVALFVPQVMSMVVVGIIWRWFFTVDGPVNQFFMLIGLESWVRPWLGDLEFARYAVGSVGSWVQYGLCMVLFLAGIQAIDEELYDAAKVYGANAFQQFRYVTLPGLRQQIIVAFVLTFIAALRVFDLVFVLTNGGNPAKRTYVTTMMVYEETFRFNRAGYGAAIAVTLSLIIIVISLIVFYMQQRGEAENG